MSEAPKETGYAPSLSTLFKMICICCCTLLLPSRALSAWFPSTLPRQQLTSSARYLDPAFIHSDHCGTLLVLGRRGTPPRFENAFCPGTKDLQWMSERIKARLVGVSHSNSTAAMSVTEVSSKTRLPPLVSFEGLQVCWRCANPLSSGEKASRV